MMNIIKEENGTKTIFHLKGRLDTMTAPELESELSTSLDNVTELEFDMNGLDYISSAGLRILLECHKRMSTRGSMVIRHANNEILETFEITGFDEILTVEP